MVACFNGSFLSKPHMIELDTLNISIFIHLSLMPADFPCTYPGCHRTFKGASYRSWHYNTQHHPLSPDSEPDRAHEFRIQYHPKLNGKYYIIER